MAVYQPNFCSPQNSTIDGDLEQIFQCTVQASVIDSYQLKIYTLSNILIYDSTKTILTPTLYQGDVLTHILPASTLTNGTQYFYIFTVFQGLTSATSRQTPFYCYATSTVSMTVPAEITSCLSS